MARMPKPLTLAPVRPNKGIEAAYRLRLEALIAEMQRSVLYFVKAAYRANAPEMAQDRSPAKELQATMKRLGSRWQRRFDALAPDLARYFSTAAHKRVDATLSAAMKRAGFTVSFKMTREVNDIVQASVAENVALIQSIPAQMFTQVEGAVMRSVQTGRDLGSLATELEQHFGVTKRRAAFISQDQNNKATAVVTRARQAEIGITEAQWLHSAGGRHPRPSHVKAGRDRVRYNVHEGWLDPATNRRIWPGTEIHCRCVARSIIPGLERA